MKQNNCIQTKLLALLLLLTPMLVLAQTKNVVSTHRVFPKIDKVLEFEKAIAAHAQKYHSGDNHWRVFAIASGPDMGGYHITEGPKTWDSEDSRGDISPEHDNDWHKSVAIFLTDRQSGLYAVYVDSLSTVGMGDFSDKIQITHVFPKLGWSGKIVNLIKKLKAAWAAEGSTISVYQANGSGPAQFALVTRYKQGLKEKNSGFRKPFKQTYDAVHGNGAYDEYLEDLRNYTADAWTELLFYKKELSSK